MHHSISHWIHDIWYYYLRTMAINRDKLNLVVTVKFNIGDFLPYKYKFCWTKPFFSKGISVCLGLFFNSSDQNYHILATAQNRLIIFNFKSLPNAICKVILCFYFLSRMNSSMHSWIIARHLQRLMRTVHALFHWVSDTLHTSGSTPAHESEVRMISYSTTGVHLIPQFLNWSKRTWLVYYILKQSLCFHVGPRGLHVDTPAVEFN